MRELTLRVEDPQICINGCTFSLLLDDLELYTRAQAVFETYAQFAQTPKTPAQVLAAGAEVTAMLEQALGVGAVCAISGGKPVSLPLALEWLGEIAREAADHYADLAPDEE